jgi:hypothetical protein
MGLPEADSVTGYLPAGDHEATLEEIEERFGSKGPQRKRVMEGLRFVVEHLRQRNVVEIYVSGSFVTAKERPKDADVVYVPPQGSDPDTWASFAPAQRETLKRNWRVDLWPYPSPQPIKKQPGKTQTIKDLFATDDDDVPRGMVKVVEK